MNVIIDLSWEGVVSDSDRDVGDGEDYVDIGMCLMIK